MTSTDPGSQARRDSFGPHDDTLRTPSKVPAVTLGYWIIKILATTLGETGGDAVTMSMKLGYLVGTAIFASIFVAAVAAQVRATRFHPFLYWAVIVATTTVGTTLADFVTRDMGIGYLGGSVMLLSLLAGSLAVWYRACGTVAVQSITTTKAEVFYWLTIMVSQTLGTALGDWAADSAGLGYLGAAGIFGVGLVILTALYVTTAVSRVFLFWSAFILTRPLGATVGDFLDKPLSHGGLELSRYTATAVIAGLIIICIAAFPKTAGDHPA